MYGDQATEALWEQLRATRWNPPAGATATAERRSTYVFALEQAEQMFRAAATVDPATRPLLVFYGLSQAGRAIAAAASSIESGDGWKLSGHGISSVGLDGPLPEVEVRTGKNAGHESFVRLSELLGSPLWARHPCHSTNFGTFYPRTSGHRSATLAASDERPCGSSIATCTPNRIRWRAFQSSGSRPGW